MNEQTISNLKKLKSFHNGSFGADIERAIQALEQQPCEDAVSRQAVIDAIDNIDWYHISNKGELVQGANKQTMPLYKAADIFYAIDALPPVTPQQTRWIPVSEKLPEKQGWYLVTDAAGGMRMTEHSFFVPQDGEMEEPYWDYMNVVAWMPLPQPYKADMRGD